LSFRNLLWFNLTIVQSALEMLLQSAWLGWSPRSAQHVHSRIYDVTNSTRFLYTHTHTHTHTYTEDKYKIIVEKLRRQTRKVQTGDWGHAGETGNNEYISGLESSVAVPETTASAAQSQKQRGDGVMKNGTDTKGKGRRASNTLKPKGRADAADVPRNERAEV
jgi:hypothetical protein